MDRFPPTNFCSLDSKAEEVLQTYLQSKEAVSNAILHTDQSLTEKETEIEGKKWIREQKYKPKKLITYKICNSLTIFLF